MFVDCVVYDICGVVYVKCRAKERFLCYKYAS